MSYKTNNRHRKKDLFITTNGKATWTVKLSKLKLGIFFQTSSTHFVKISTARVDQNRTAVLCFMVLRSLKWIFVISVVDGVYTADKIDVCFTVTFDLFCYLWLNDSVH